MDFTKASQNGVKPPTDYKTKASNMAVGVSTSTIKANQQIIIKAISNAVMYKTEPVTFYSNFTPINSTSSSTITLGTATFVDTVNAPLVYYGLAAGTHQIYATWPGENRYAPVTTENVPLTVNVGESTPLTGGFFIYAYPASGQLIAGEGTATFSILATTPIQLTGNIIFYKDNSQIGVVPVYNNNASINIPDFSPGTHTVKAIWPGATVNGTDYPALTTSTTYVVNSGTNISNTVTMSLTIFPNHGIVNEIGNQLQAVLYPVGEPGVTLPSTLPGNISFYLTSGPGINPFAPQLINTVPIQNNVFNRASTVLPNTLSTGTYQIVAVWDGNQPNHPSYVPIASSATYFSVLAKETITNLTLTLSPADTYYTEPVTLTAVVDASTMANSIVGQSISFYDGNILLGISTVDYQNHAVLNLPTLNTGTHNLYAYFAGSSTQPKVYPKKSNVVTTATLSGEPLSFVLAFESNTYLDPAPGYYVNEPFNLVLTNNSTGTTVNGSTATFTIDDTFISDRVSVCENSTTSTVIFGVGSTISGYTPGTRLYHDIYGTQYLASVVSANTGNNSLTLNTSIYLSTAGVPIWFLGPNYHPLGAETFVGNTATAVITYSTATKLIAYSDWIGTQINDGHYYAEEIDYANTITLALRQTPGIVITSTNVGYVGEPITFNISDTLSTKYYNWQGTTATVYIDNSGTVNTFTDPNTLTGQVTYFTTGSHNLHASIITNKQFLNVTDPSRTYYLNGTANSNIVTATIIAHTYPGSLILTNPISLYNQIMANTLTLTVNTSTSIKGVVSLKEGTGTNVITTASFNNNSITFNIPAGTLNSGTHSLRAYWNGTYLSFEGAAPYYYGGISNTATITIFNANSTTISLSVNGTSYGISNGPAINYAIATISPDYPAHQFTGTVTLWDKQLSQPIATTNIIQPGTNIDSFSSSTLYYYKFDNLTTITYNGVPNVVTYQNYGTDTAPLFVERPPINSHPPAGVTPVDNPNGLFGISQQYANYLNANPVQGKFNNALNTNFDAFSLIRGLEAPPNYTFGTGDFTYEFWYYANSTILPPLSIQFGYMIIDFTPKTIYVANVGPNGVTQYSSTIPTTYWVDNTWIHYAYVKHNGTAVFYINGVAVTSMLDPWNYNTTGQHVIELPSTYGNPVTIGTIDEVRITTAARYTNNFIPTNQPYPMGVNTGTVAQAYFNYNVLTGVSSTGTRTLYATYNGDFYNLASTSTNTTFTITN